MCGNFTIAKAALLPFDLVMAIKNPFLLSIFLSGVLFLCSCDKPKLLMAEREKIESEIRRLQLETKALDDKFLALGVNAANANLTLERNNSELMRTNVLLEQELVTLTKQCALGDDVVNTFRPKLESYKSRFSR